MKKLALVSMPLAVALAVIAYLLLARGPNPSSEPAPSEPPPSEPAPAPEQAGSTVLVDPAPGSGEGKSAPYLDLMAADGTLKQMSIREGDQTMFTVTQDEIGYVDVDSVVRDLNPYSVVALLQYHQNLTGAGESLEVMIDSVSENDIWGYQAIFTQLIQGRPTRGRGSVIFFPNGAVSRMFGEILNDQAINAGSVVIQPAEVEAIAREASVRFIRPYLAMFNEHARQAGFTEQVRGVPAEMNVFEPELNFVLDADKQLRAEWHVMVGAAYEELLVRLTADTGEVVSVESLYAE